MKATRYALLLWVVLPGVLILVVVALLFSLPQPLALGDWVRLLPAAHASVNAATTLLLLVALWAIRRRKPRLHKQLMYVCVGLGLLFLSSYLLYHGSVPSTRYGDINGDGLLSTEERSAAGNWRITYLILLLSHIVTATLTVFLVLMALHYARIAQFKRHKAIVRYAFPMWWYVSLSGVLIYLLIRPFYQLSP